MDNQTVFMLFVAVALAVVFAYLYFSLNSRVNEAVQAKVEQWKRRQLEHEKERLLELARSEARLELDQWKRSETKAIRSDAIARSQAVTLGKVTEHIIPYLPDFAFNPKDVRFLGTPVDFVAFDGLSAGRVEKVVFVEVKTAGSKLSARERSVKAAVEAGSVEWLDLRFAPKVAELS